MPRSSKTFKKRKFQGNKKVNKDFSPRPTSTQNVESKSVSASKKKLSDSFSQYNEELNDNFEYVIVDLKNIENLVNNIAYCKVCHSSLNVTKQRIAGLACEISVRCNNYEQIATSENCSSVSYKKNDHEHKLYDLNIRLVLGLRNIGKGRIAAEKLCAVMNMNPPYSRFHLYEEFLSGHVTNICKQFMQNAVLEAIYVNDKFSDLAVALDGSWQRRGHKSLNGVVSATSLNTGKVVDIEVLSKYCLCKGRLQDNHDEDCSANCSGSSGSMEVTGAINIFKRSQDLYAVRYTEYLGDGDTKAYAAVNESKPYGETNIERIECIGHVQKRMGTRLKKLKLTTKKLPDGSSLGGRGGLTDAAILQIQKYYGLAIRRNHKSVEDMKKAVWAEFFHLLSSNEDPQHGLCPDDDSTWCKYRKAVRSNETYDHTKHFHLPKHIMCFIKPIFQDLADPKLLVKCLGGKSQNSNESLNNVIWNYIPKGTFVRLKTLRVGVNLAVCNFNDGAISLCKVIEQCGLKPGKYLVSAMKKIDQRRIQAAEKYQNELLKKIRQQKSLMKKKLEDKFEEEEGECPSYASGLY